MFVSETKLRVRYGETDQMGVVYNGNYSMYFEIGRTEALRQLNLTYHTIEQKGVMMPVHSMSMVFKRPAFYDDELTIKSFFKSLPETRAVIHYEIRNSANELICEGETTLVFVDQKSKRPMRCPEFILDVFRPFFE